MKTWENLSYEEKIHEVKEINETYSFTEYYDNSESAAYNVVVGYENEPEWFGFEVENIDNFEIELRNIIQKLYFDIEE